MPGSNRTAMMTTLTRLAEIEEDYRIFPGHGDSSTLRREQQANPYLKGYLGN